MSWTEVQNTMWQGVHLVNAVVSVSDTCQQFVNKLFHSTEKKNHRMAKVGRGLRGHESLTPKNTYFHFQKNLFSFCSSVLDKCSNLLSSGRHSLCFFSTRSVVAAVARSVPAGSLNHRAAEKIFVVHIHILLCFCFCQYCADCHSSFMGKPASQQHLQLELLGLVANIFCWHEPREFVKHRKELTNWEHNTGGWDFAGIGSWIFKGTWHISTCLEGFSKATWSNRNMPFILPKFGRLMS